MEKYSFKVVKENGDAVYVNDRAKMTLAELVKAYAKMEDTTLIIIKRLKQ